jgi:hypothetical protein
MALTDYPVESDESNAMRPNRVVRAVRAPAGDATDMRLRPSQTRDGPS